MENNVFTFKTSINWDLIRLISKIDRFDASWSSIEKKEGQVLKQLKSIATVRSVGASTRIEGSKMNNDEIEVLLKHIDITKLVDRDTQEVVGYFNTLDIITGSYQDIRITESSIKSLHNILLKHCNQDSWHKGGYKQHNNAVEANYPDGTKSIIFQTTEAGISTEDAMRRLFEWYNSDTETHPLVKCASFCYEFVSIHPFQDGNGRLSRLIATLLLLKNGYQWIQYVSFEHEIESKKDAYYRALRNCQSQRPNEDITEWIVFFLNSLLNIQFQLLEKLELSGLQSRLSPKEKSILSFIGNHSGCKSGEIAKKLDIPNPTAKRILSDLLLKNLIVKHGNGPGTNYSIE